MTPHNPFFQKIRSHLYRSHTLAFLLTGLFFVLILSPLLGLCLDILQTIGRGNLDLISPFFLSSRRLDLLASSIGFAGSVAVSGIFVGTLLVSFLWRASRMLLVFTLLSLLALAAIPPYIHALTWSAVLGYLAVFFPVVPVSGWGISYWVEFMALLPFSTLLVWIAFASVDPTLIEAGRVVRPDAEIFGRILLPLSKPALGTAFGLLFLLCCSDYSIPSLFGTDVYAMDIFAQFSLSASPSLAFLYAIPLMLVTMLVVIACRSGIRTLAQTPDWLSTRFGTSPHFPHSFLLLQDLACIIIVLQILVLVSGLIFATGSFAAFTSSVIMAQRDLYYSLMIALGVVIFTLPIAMAAAYELKKPGLRGTAAWTFVLLPLAIPASLTGIGMITFWNALSPIIPYSGFFLPIMVSIARFAPISAIILFVQLRFIDPILFDAAEVFSQGVLMNWTEIRIPLLAPGFLVAAGILAALTLAELGATLVVVPPGHATLTMRIYNYLHYGAAAEVAGLCLLMTIITLIAGAFTISALYWMYKKNRTAVRKSGVVRP